MATASVVYNDVVGDNLQDSIYIGHTHFLMYERIGSPVMTQRGALTSHLNLVVEESTSQACLICGPTVLVWQTWRAPGVVQLGVSDSRMVANPVVS